MDARKMCTCKDTSCPNHPTNHSEGCTPCIEKNLRMGEIPGCFFNAVGHPADMQTYFYRDFAECVMRKEAQK